MVSVVVVRGPSHLPRKHVSNHRVMSSESVSVLTVETWPASTWRRNCASFRVTSARDFAVTVFRIILPADVVPEKGDSTPQPVRGPLVNRSLVVASSTGHKHLRIFADGFADTTVAAAPQPGTCGRNTCNYNDFLVGRTGLEPVTPCVSCKCATRLRQRPLRGSTLPPTQI